jgi:hypothetical protein
MTSLAPVPSSDASTCANCGAALVEDQRYCLSCGQPVSPVRLAFLDVLDSERNAPAAGAAGTPPIVYSPHVASSTEWEAVAGPAWLRRYAPLFAVLSVLLLALVVGLLVGHWVTQDKASPAGPQVIKIEGLAGAPAVASATPSTSTGASSTPSSGGGSAASAKSEEARERAEAKKEEEEEAKHPAAAPAPKEATHAIQKLEKTTGKKHEEELNKLSTAPIEVK